MSRKARVAVGLVAALIAAFAEPEISLLGLLLVPLLSKGARSSTGIGRVLLALLAGVLVIEAGWAVLYLCWPSAPLGVWLISVVLGIAAGFVIYGAARFGADSRTA